MKRALGAALSTVVLVACQDHHGPTLPPSDPAPFLAIVDGHNDPDRSHFFFLAPIRPIHTQPPRTAPFNPSLSPVVEICELADAHTCVAGDPISRLTMTDGPLLDRVYVFPRFEEYAALWRTRPLNLDPNKIYRIHVLVGTQVLGYADVDIVRTFRQALQVDRDEFVPLIDDLILPIRFRIEEGALCDPGTTCTSETVDLSDDQPDEVTSPQGDVVTIPPQNQGGQQVQVTLTLTQCEEEIRTGLPAFGRCLTVTADPPLDDALDPPAVISICDADFAVHEAIEQGLIAEGQEPLVTLHRRSGETIQALPHADDRCAEPIGSAGLTGWRGLAAAGWGLVRRSVAAAIGPQKLYASLVVLDRGGGGESEFFSDFQFALPAQMAPLAGADGQSAPAGGEVPVDPGVFVTDVNGNPVTGATIFFQVTAGGGSVSPESVMTDSGGVARVASWTLGAPGPQQLRAFALGIAGPADSGPFTPPIPSPDSSGPVDLDLGEVFFHATALSPSNDLMSGSGTCTVDGVLSAGEWDSAAAVPFAANLPNPPDSGTTPATLYVMNDSTNLCLAVRFQRSVVDPGNSLAFEFDNDDDGLRENGDDVFLVNSVPSTPSLAFIDDFRTNGTAPRDTDDGGTNDGAGASSNDGTFTVYEMSHPLNSADDAHDFSLTCGTVGMYLDLRMIAAGAVFPAGFGDTRFPASGFLHITLAGIPACPPPGGGLSLDSLDLSNNALVIGGAQRSYTAYVTNAGGATETGVIVQGFIQQGSATRAAGGTMINCTVTPGNVPPGTCAVDFTLGASNTAAGSGTLVPGAATARWLLTQGGTVIDVLTLPVVLLAAETGLSLDSLDLSADSLVIDGAQATYTAYVTNAGAATETGVIVQGYIVQGAASRAAGGTMTNCTATPGDAPPGTCAVGFTLGASNSAAGSGTLVPGPATARWELTQGGALLDVFTRAVVLLP